MAATKVLVQALFTVLRVLVTIKPGDTKMKITYSSWICLSAAIAASGSVATFAHAKESLSYAQATKSAAAKTSVSSKRNSRSPASAEDAEKLILGS